jgi:hypothetical protein
MRFDIVLAPEAVQDFKTLRQTFGPPSEPRSKRI